MFMQAITAPIKLNENSAAVANLQAALIALGISTSPDEIKSKTAGPATIKAVRNLQQQNNLQFNDVLLVDDITAAFLNRVLKEKNLLDEPVMYNVTGRVLNPLGETLATKNVQAFDVDLRGARIYRTAKTLDEIKANDGFQLLGTAVSSTADGSYSISFTRTAFDAAELDLADIIVYTLEDNKITGRSLLSTEADYKDGLSVSGWDVVVAGTADRGKSEFSSLSDMVNRFLAVSNVPVKDLFDSADQVAFLATEGQQDIKKVQVFVDSAQLSQSFPNNPESQQLLYGLGRKNVPLSFSFIALTPQEKLTGAWQQAMADNTIDAIDEATVKGFLSILHTTSAVDMIAAPKTEAAVSLVAGLKLTSADANIQASFLSASRTFTGTPEEFWNVHLPALPEFAAQPQLIKSFQLTNQLVALTGNYIPLVAALQTENRIQHPSDLLALTSDDWTGLLTKTGLPEDTRGATAQEKISNYRDQIQSVLHAAYPTQKIAAMVNASELQVATPEIKQGISSFLTTAATFDFKTSRLSDFEDQLNQAGGQNKPALKETLARIQRLYAISPTADALSKLMDAGFHSANQVANTPQQAFMDSQAVHLGGADMARAVHQRASFQTMRIEKLVASVNEAAYSATPQIIMSAGNTAAAKKLIDATIPNWTTLFRSPDSCQCEECRSVYSASAYLVDILQFLGNIKANFFNDKPLDILLHRRPDIAFLPLTCENTNTLVPYIDLANEIMEYYVAHGSLDDKAAYDTGDTTAGELRASPQNTLKDAYGKLKDAVYPFSLPYHQPLDVQRIYYRQMRTTRAEVMTVLQTDFSDPASRAVHAEMLAICQEEYRILAGKDFGGTSTVLNTRDYYGTYADDNDFISRIYKIPEFLRSTGLQYTDAIDLLQTGFINPGQPILDYMEELFTNTTLTSAVIYQKLKAIAAGADPASDADIMTALNASTISAVDFKAWAGVHFPVFQQIITLFQSSSDCDLGSTQLRTLQSVYENQADSGISLTDVFPKIHRFIRLWRKLGWSMLDLDTVTAALGEKNITMELIDKLAMVGQIAHLISIPLNKLATVWGNIQMNGKNALYKKLFLNRTIQQIDPSFQANQWGAYLDDPSKKLQDHVAALQAAFRISGEDMSLIFTDTNLPADTSVLNIENLSRIYRYIVLAKALSISVSDLITIKQLFQINPFSVYDPVQKIFTAIDPQVTLSFVTLVMNIKASGFNISMINYVIGDVADPQRQLNMPGDTVRKTLLAARKGFVSIEQDHPEADLQNNITDDLLRSKMQLIFNPDMVNTLIGLVNGSAVSHTTTDKNLPVTITAPQNAYITYIKASGRLQATGVLSDNDKTALNNLPGANAAFQNAVEDLYQQPGRFLKDNFLALFPLDLNDAIAALFNHPAQIKVLSQQEKLNWFYKKFLPYLKNQLRRNIVIQNVATVIGLDEPTTQALAQSQLAALVNTLSQTGLSGTYFTDETFSTAGLNRTDRQLDFSWQNNSPDPTIPADHFSVRWEGYVNPPTSADYTFIVEVTDADDAFKLYLDDQIIIEKPSGNAQLSWEALGSLAMSRAYKIKIEYIGQTGSSGIHLYWKTETTPRQLIETANLYASKVFDELALILKKYQKGALFISGYKLSVQEVSHFIAFNVNFNAIDFTAISKEHWLRIFDYTVVRQSAPSGLIGVFELASRNSPVSLIDELSGAIIGVTGWNPATVSWLVKNHFNFQVSDFKNEIALNRLLKATALMQKTGVGAQALSAWSAPQTDFTKLYDQSQEIKKAVKAKYEDDGWQAVAKKLSDTLRENQKLALVSYLLVQAELIRWGVIDADSLYEYFLIDVQMCACMDTSRIVQATAAVQLFVTRCLLNLESRPDPGGHETGVAPDQIDQSSQTKWQGMQYYRVWEAYRKIFLYPENWLDPEYRDDKSSFFKELESELLQNDITSDSVDGAFYNYLNKLDEVSHLDVCGMFQENDGNGNMMNLHVFGRTHGKPHLLYYRTCNPYWHWSAWEKVPVDVKGVDASANSSAEIPVAGGVHLTPIVWKNRLYLFWPEFLKKQPADADKNSSTFQQAGNHQISGLHPKPYWEISLGWTEYKNGKWTPKNISKEFLRPSATVKMKDMTTYYGTLPFEYEADLKNYFVHPAVDANNALHLSLIHQRTDNHGKFIVSDTHNPVRTEYVLDPAFFAGFFGGGKDTTPKENYTSFFMQLQYKNELKLKGNSYLRSAPDHKITYSPQVDDFESSLNYPFFYRDDERSYFIRTTDITYFLLISVLKTPEKSKYIALNLSQSAEVHKMIPRVSVEAGLSASFSGSPANFAGGALPDNVSPVDPAGGIRPQPLLVKINFSQSMSDKADNSMLAAAFAGDKAGLSTSIDWLIFDKGLTFYANYHPYAQAFIQSMNTKGIDGLMRCDTTLPDDGGSLFEKTYLPHYTDGLVQKPADLAKYTYYKENVAFDEFSLYGLYNWELFYHTPLYIATRLSKNGKYQEALKWFNYIFDPTTSETASDPNLPESRYWKVLPFKTTTSQSLLDYFKSLQPGQDDPHIDEWRNNPAKPFLVARDRPIAFMKNVVMKYIDNLVAWGDDLFRTDTRENINTATQLYIIAAHILGPLPQSVPLRGKIKAETYHSLKPKLDAFSNAMVDLENLFPYSSQISLSDNPFPGSMLGVGSTLYFCIPSNDRLLQYWDTVADRLFKIRHCMNIEGVERSLSLFAPPIDPGLLVRASASGLSIGSILADLNSPAPLYRFSYLVQKATEFCVEVKALGTALLTAIEKREGEELVRIRAAHESKLLTMMSQVRQRQVLEAKANKENLEKTREGLVRKIQYHLDYLGITGFTIPAGPDALPADIDKDYALPDTLITDLNMQVDVSLSDSDTIGVKIIPKEKEQMAQGKAALSAQMDAIQSEIMSGFFALIPELGAHATPLGVGVALSFGGKALSWISSSEAKTKGGESAAASHSASRAATMATYIRREQEITQQANQDLRQLAQLDKQSLAADIRIQIAQKELDNHQQQIDNAQEIEDYLFNQLSGHTKFTTQELYLYMKEQLFLVYKQSYQMAFDMARRAERAYQFDLGIADSNFIQYGYFDSTYQGLTSGEQLHFAIRQMEKSFVEQNKREFELAKHVSLAMTRPDLLVKLKQFGSCEWSWPEELFDLDYPGHYFRRIKSVSLSIPCVAGPYTSVNATLRLLNNAIRINTANGDSGYAHNNDSGILTDDDRFRETRTPFVAIATSSAQNDSGLFELNFRDERYLPFEGAGVISKWKLELNGKYLQDDGSVMDIAQFDFNTISDIIIHLHYTAREDAGLFRQNTLAHLQDYFTNVLQNLQPPLMRAFSAKNDLSADWYHFLHPLNTADDQVFTIDLNITRFPFFVQKKGIKITAVELISDSSLATINGLQLISPDPATDTVNLVSGGSFGKLLHAAKDYTGSEKAPGVWMIKNPVANTRLTDKEVSNLIIIVHYETR
jgi:hypothetical protein